MRNRFIYPFLLSLYTLSAFFEIKAQGKIVDYKVTVPSPQAYAFAQYADMPVSLYTGTPSIEIPIYTINVGNYTFPISLSYHASGISVTQEASWVGLGWNLNAGGNISRTVRGLDDLMGGYYYQNVQIPSEVDEDRNDIIVLISTGYKELSMKIAVDTEPDVFYYNFLGYCGKFYCKNSGKKEENGFYLNNPEQNLKITFTYSDQSFTIIAPDGTQYLFKPSSSTYSSSVQFNEIRVPYTDMTRFPYNNDQKQNMVTSWDLHEITFPNKEKIQFEYTMVSYPFLPACANTVQKIYNPIDIIQNPGSTSSIAVRYETVFSANVVSYQKFLKKITWNSGHIVFETNTRRDFARNTFNPGGDQLKLDKMSVFRNGDSQPFKEIIFHESYFTNPDEPEDQYNLRLRLDSLSVCSGTIREVHTFGYDTRHPLPPKYSFAQDLWGYYNGINNTMFYPEITVSQNCYKADGRTIAYKKGEKFGGANRKPQAEYITTGMLTSIESPEGGITTFEYEPNEAMGEYSEIVFLRKENLQKPASIEVDTFYFTLNTPSWIKLDFWFNESGAMGVENTPYKNNLISIYDLTGKEIKNWGINNFIDKDNFNYTIKDSSRYERGGYYLVFRTGNFLDQKWLNLTFYQQIDDIRPIYGGGVRIARIQSPVNTKEFTYTDATGHASSGIFIRKPFHESLQTFYKYGQTSTGTQTNGILSYMVQQSESVYPLTSPAANAAVGYSQVWVTTRSENKFYKEEYLYHNEQESVDRRYVGMPGEQIYMNGKLLTYNVYEESKLIQNTKHKYKSNTIATLNAWFQDYCNLGDIGSYHMPIEHCRLEQTIEGNFDMHSSAKNWKTTLYKQYNPENYLPSEISVNDGLKETTVQTTYTVDLKHIPLYGEMCSNVNNRIADPVETRTYRNSVLVQKELQTYKKNGKNNSYVPDAAYSYYMGSSQPASDFDGSNISQYGMPDYTFSGYDKYDNVTEVQSRTGESEVYIRGYNGQYVIARIINATLGEVENAGIGPLDNFAGSTKPSEEEWNKLNALRALLPHALVYTYKYEPMIGVTSITDPKGMTLHYEYDAKGRLTVERDGDNNIIKTYRYTLKNER